MSTLSQAQQTIGVLIVDDHTIVREGLSNLLELDADINIVGEAENGCQAVALVDRLRPDVVLMDVTMPVMCGLEACRRLSAAPTGPRVLMLTMHEDEEHIVESFRAGAAGYVAKEADVSELLEAIRTVHRGGRFLSPRLARLPIEHYLERARSGREGDRLTLLTNREREVLQLVAEGWQNQEISRHLSISIKTVEAHRTNVSRKLDIHSIAELTQFAIRHHLVQ